MPTEKNNQNKNLNTAEFWDKEYRKEWNLIRSDKPPENTCEYRWDGFRFSALSWRIPHKGKMLDVGCGLGHFCRYLRAKCVDAEIWGIDFSPWAIRHAKKLAEQIGAKIQFVVGEALDLPFQDNFFDIVVAMEILEHLSEPEKFMEEAKRVLKPGGRIFFTTPWRGLLAKDGLHSEEHVQEWTPQEMAKLIEKHFGGGEIIIPPALIDKLTGRQQQVFWFLIICTK
jgi:2-polyprenyl-3-methyl-5-hydroxy-6-metoxy-1,4-benzoquinol methylase